MSDSDKISADYAALNELIVNCPEFERLEALLGGFNLFQVLKFEHGEIRHSNVLAWIVDPNESHGLDSSFLKKWLMRVIHEASGQAVAPVAAVDIDAWQLQDVEVRREWQNIDLLLVLSFANQEQWVICIENKVNASQSDGQLLKYRTQVEKMFPHAKHRIYLFLTKNNEEPDDDAYVAASYTQVHKVLKECLQAKSHVIGTEPKVLLENYIRLLEEKFMDESEIARTARKIYQQHRRALDVIFEQRPDNLKLVSDKVRILLDEKVGELDFFVDSYSKAYIRLLPKSWAHLGNTHGAGWSGSKRTILFEMSFTGKRPQLYVISGKAPDTWIGPVWLQAAKPPFRRVKRTVRPVTWCSLHILNSKVSLNEDDMDDPDGIALKICDWCLACLKDDETQQVIQIIAAQMPALEDAYAANSK
ncbi:MAG: PD-(D/E)XK nuclease family protein [Verrucomicrobiota bacterium]